MIVDLFAGPGGWDEGLARLGVTDVLGIELDPKACATADAAGHARLCADITTLDPADYDYDGLIASPPCQEFSRANSNGKGLNSDRGSLVYEVLRWAETRPRWIACEQVPDVMPVWREFALQLERAGYRCAVGLLNAADYGLPQSRKRAILLASLDVQPLLPPATHGNPLFGLPERITAAEGLSREDLPTWATERPATTVVGSFNPEVIAAPGYRVEVSRQNAPDSFETTIAERGVLQGFPADYPWQGSKSSQSLQVGNAIPPPLAAAVLRQFVASVETAAA